MPFMGSEGFDYEQSNRFAFGNPNLRDYQAAALGVVDQNRSMIGTIVGSVGLGVVDLVDTAASSIPGVNRVLGAERGDVNRWMLSAIDMPGLTDFYNDNQGAIEVASAVEGIVVSELLTRKLTAPASLFMRGLRQLPYVRRLVTLDAEYANAMQTVRSVDMVLAQRGAIGMEQYIGRATVGMQRFDPITGGMIDAGTREVGRRAAVFGAKTRGAAVGARHAAVAESIIALTMNQNGFLFDDDAAYNLAWMGLGVGIGGAFDWVHSAYRIRRFVNSDEVRRSFAGALDPRGIEESRLLWHGREVKPDENVSFLGGSISDRITSLLVNATTLTSTPIGRYEAPGAAAQLLAQRESLATQHRQLAQEEAAKITTKGISTNGHTRFGRDAPGYSNHLDMLMYRDSGSLYGIEMIGGVPDESTIHAVHQSHARRLDERIVETEERLAAPDLAEGEGDELANLRRRLEYEKQLTPMAVIDGERVPISEAEAIEGFIEPDIRFVSERTQGFRSEAGENPRGLWETVTENPQGGVRLEADFTITLPGNRSVDTADHFDILRLYRVSQRAIGDMVKWVNPIQLPNKPSWFQLDLAEEILRRSNDNAKVVFPKGMTRESAQVESLVQKAKSIQRWNIKDANLTSQAASKKQTYEGMLSKLRVRYNLPRLTAYERGVLGEVEHPVMGLLRGIDGYGEDEIRNLTLAEVRESAAKLKRLGDLAPVTSKDLDLFGNSFRYMLDESGKPVKPLIMYARPFQKAEWFRNNIAERLAVRHITTIAHMTNRDAAPMTRGITGSVIQSPDYDAASRTHELMDVQIQGSIVGSAPQSFLGTLGKSVITSERRDVDSPIMLAATRLQDGVNRQARSYMQQIIEGAFGDSLGRLENPRNAISKLLLNQFHSFRSGWDIAKQTVERTAPDGKKLFAFTLSNTEGNRSRWKQLYKVEMPLGQTMLGPNGREIVVDELGLEIQKQFNAVTDALHGEKNTLLRANGMGEIDRVDHYVPPPNTNGKFIGFVIGPDGLSVPNMSVVASTQDEFTKARNAMIPRIEELGLGYTFRTQDEIRDFATIWDRAQMDFIDPGTTAIQPRKPSRGALTGSEVKVNAFDESLQYLRNQFLRHSNDLIETLMKDPINAAKARANIASDVTRNRASFYRDQKFRSVYDMYLENLLGRTKLAATGSLWGQMMNPVEGAIDKFLEEGTPPVAKVWAAVGGWLGRSNPWSRDALARRDFETLSDRLGEHMPFESATKMLERQGAGATPPTVAKITGGLNRFSAAMILRVAEVAHPIMNMTGMVNAMPAVIRHLAQREGETVEMYARRIGHAAHIFDLGDGRQIGTLDMVKIASRGFNRAWKRASHADYDYMVRHGYLTQEVAEFQRQFGAINSRRTWQNVFVGNPTSPNRFMQKGLVGWASTLSDRSEDFSRSWGHMVGLELADELGVKGLEARHALAHDFANKMIANYSPHNRPEIFQGALGAPLGLFQSFIINYYQRLFRYVETKDYRALGTQFAVQGSLFGVTSLPGWAQFNNFMMENSEGESDLTGGIWRRFGGPAGDLIGAGVISNLPKLFGAPGVDLYSRGDTNVRIPGLAGNAVPAWTVVSRLWQGINQGLRAFSDGNPSLSGTQLAEIASNMIANRPIAGMIEQFLAGGNDTDKYGQLVSETRGLAEASYRIIGLRSMEQSRQVQAFYSNKQAMEHKAAADEVLRLSTRAAIRAGNFDSLPAIFNQYLANGGDPRYFRRWIRSNYEAATETRSERQLEETLNNPDRMDQTLRLLDAGVSIDADEATPDPESVLGAMDANDPMNQPETGELVDGLPGGTLMPEEPTGAAASPPL